MICEHCALHFLSEMVDWVAKDGEKMGVMCDGERGFLWFDYSAIIYIYIYIYIIL